MVHPDALLSEVQRWLAERVAAGESLRQLAAKAGLSEPSLLGSASPEWNPTVKTLRKLAELRTHPDSPGKRAA